MADRPLSLTFIVPFEHFTGNDLKLQLKVGDHQFND